MKGDEEAGEARLEEQDLSKKLKDDMVLQPTERSEIDILNDDALLMIFKYLDMYDLIRIERVSKKWKDLSLMSWINIKKINAGKDGTCSVFIDSESNVASVHLADILKKAGSYLTHLSISTIGSGPKPTPNQIFQAINDYCKNLQELKFMLDHRESINFRLLSQNVAENLKLLHIHHAGGKFRERDLENLLEKAVNLEDFLISTHYQYVKGSALLKLSAKCERLSLEDVDCIDDGIFSEVLKRLPNLKHLNLYKTTVDPELLAPIAGQLVSLDTWFLSGRNFDNMWFSNLRKLRVGEDIFMKAEELISFLKKCPVLEDIDFFRHQMLEDDFYRQLPIVKNLKHLEISKTEITDAALKYLAPRLQNLESITCCCCMNTTPSGLLEFIRLSPNLKKMSISPSEWFNTKFFQTAEKYVRERSNNMPLTIALGFSFITYDGDPSRYDEDVDIRSEVKRLKLKPWTRESGGDKCLKIIKYCYPKWDSKKSNAVWCVSTKK